MKPPVGLVPNLSAIRGPQMKPLSSLEVRALVCLGRVAIVLALFFAVLALFTPLPYARHLCVLSALIAVLSHVASTPPLSLLLLLAAGAVSTSCTAVELRQRDWVIPVTSSTMRTCKTRETSTSLPTELDQLVSGCNAYLMTQRDAAAIDEQRVRQTQRAVALIGGAIEVVVGAVSLSLQSYSYSAGAALTGGIGSTVTGVLGGSYIGLWLQPDPIYDRRRTAIMTAWNAIETYSSGASQPDPARLLPLFTTLRNACAGVLPN